MKLKNQVVAITGGSRGIGKSIAEFCKQEGARIAIAARSADEVQKTVEDLRRIHPEIPCIGQSCDMSKAEDTVQFFQKSAKELGPLTGLICAAGVYGSIGSFVETPFAEWEKAIDINLKGTALSVHTAFPFFDKSQKCSVVLFSGGGQGPLANFSAYATSKGGVWRLTETLGEELAAHNIFLNAIAPGAVNTKLLDDLLKAGPSKVGESFYKKSMAQKEQGGTSPLKAAQLCVYLLSAESKGLYGKTLSAVWDRYEDLQNLSELSRSDLFQYRRVVNEAGGTRG